MAAKKYRDGIDFLKFMSLFAGKNNPKKELDWIFFDRENNAFVATNTHIMAIVTPQGISAAEIYDKKFPHYNSAGRDEYLDKRGFGFRHTYNIDSARRSYPDYARHIPQGDRVERVTTQSMWKTTIEQNIILDMFDKEYIRNALKAINVYENGVVTYRKIDARLGPVMYEIERKMRYGAEFEDYFLASVQVIAMPIVM